MFILHPDTVESLKAVFGKNKIKYADNYTRWGRKESYTCLAICTGLEFWYIVKLLTVDAIDYAEAERLRVETIQVNIANLLRIVERADVDPDGVFPSKSRFQHIYYFPSVHLED